jgi:hypothetical protein
MKVAAHQPNFLPNLAFFDKMQLSDRFVIITNIQFEKQEGWQQRHKIPGPNGDIWLTVPVLGSQNQLIKDVAINNNFPWYKKHIKTLDLTYGRGKGKEFLPQIASVYEKNWEKLADINVAFINLLKEILEIDTPLVVDDEVSGTKHELLVNVCKKYGADTYLSGYGAKAYLNEDRLRKISQQELRHEFVQKNLTAEYPYSTVHYLLSEGKDWALEKIR